MSTSPLLHPPPSASLSPSQSTPSTSTPLLPPIPVSITIRFATALPDLTIHIPDASRTTVASLKHQIRALRAEDTGRRKLRLIYAGKVLGRGTLAEGMKLRRPVVGGGAGGRKVYVHCAIGDEATEEEAQDGTSPQNTHPQSPTSPPRTTLPQPQGFDRLLTAGFTEADIASLRTQFNRIHNITPDSPPEHARLLEERWIDEAAGTGAGELADGYPVGTYEDIFLGVAIGFFWPVAVLALREEGVFTKRRGMAIVAGLVINLVAGSVRFIS
ncbi:DUF2407 C-terminal domain-containing protein [Peziza echinospora]|nr:DUF2407 C-terminal domain-containing protein [Peziza echinospora]